MSKKTEQVTVICAQINSKKQYIERLSRRSWDNRYLIVSHTTDPQEAREFLNEGHAQSVIQRLVNHHSREYHTETITVPVSKRHTITDEDELT